MWSSGGLVEHDTISGSWRSVTDEKPSLKQEMQMGKRKVNQELGGPQVGAKMLHDFNTETLNHNREHR